MSDSVLLTAASRKWENSELKNLIAEVSNRGIPTHFLSVRKNTDPQMIEKLRLNCKINHSLMSKPPRDGAPEPYLNVGRPVRIVLLGCQLWQWV